MSHTVRWSETETSKKIGSKTIETADGKKRQKAVTVQVKYAYPVIEADTPSDVANALGEILSKNVEGFSNFRLLLSHLQHGLYRHLAVMYNSGQDARLTPEQRKAIKMYVTLVNMPGSGMTREQAVQFLTLQGVPDAGEAFDAFVDDEEEVTADVAN